jgi:FkbM family methyltransferase
MNSINNVPAWNSSPQTRADAVLGFLSEAGGADASTTAKLLCNKATYLFMRATSRAPRRGWHTSARHWYRYPFSLFGEVLWSRQLGAWFRAENEAAMESMLHEDSYEPVDWVAPNEGDIVLDVGAFVGWHTIRAARLVGLSGRVISLEPDIINRRQLEANLTLNKIANCTVVPLGAWSTPHDNLGWYTEKSPDCCRIDVSKSPSSEGIRATTVDNLVAETGLNRVNWIKMDIEGGEVEALKGAAKTMRDHRPSVFVELHDTVQPVRDLLRQYGYYIKREAFDASPEPHGWFVAHSL